MMKENAPAFAVWTGLHWLNYLHRPSANANLAVGELRRNLERILALALAKSAGDCFITPLNFFSCFCHISLKFGTEVNKF